MASDIDGQTLWQWIVTLLGFGGWGYKSMTHGQQLEQHEAAIRAIKETREKDLSKLDKVVVSAARIDTKLDAIQEAVEQNRHLYVARRRQHIIDTEGEPDDAS